MRISTLAIVTTVALAGGVTSALAGPLLETDAAAGACGGSISCAVSQNQVIPDATEISVASASATGTLADGSYANAHGATAFGAFHIYSDAFRASGSDAQSSVHERALDDFDASQVVLNTMTNTFVLNGSHSDVEHVFGNAAQILLLWDDYDLTNGALLDSGSWESTDAAPDLNFSDSYFVPTGHGVETHVFLQTFTYSSFGIVDVADYSNTLHYYMGTGGGASDVIGLSGHDYALPAAGVPEPAAWGLMLLGFWGMGARLRRRGAQTAVVANLHGVA